MKFLSTANSAQPVSARTAVLQGLAEDGGLFMPEKIPALPPEDVSALLSRSLPEIALRIGALFFGSEVSEQQLQKIVSTALTFDAPLTSLQSDTFSVELFHGPTCAFKDFGARFMAQLLSFFAEGLNREITILVATSGDTGSAVASAFSGLASTRVVLLYPSGLVSDIQEQQLTTFGGNIFAVELQGTFDDCQRLVKSAFLDAELRQKLVLASANSINVARLIPQIFYYVRALGELPAETRRKEIVFSVPSGNFGNLTAGVFAKRMGFPISHLIAATNRNDVVPEYLQTGKFAPRASLPTISNAMDVGDPSNFARLFALSRGSVEQMRKEIYGFSFSEDETKDAMRRAYKQFGYLLDPHGAVGLLGLERLRKAQKDFTGLFLETAHPAKFGDTVRDVLGVNVDIPERLAQCLKGKKQAVLLPPEFNQFRSLLLDTFTTQ